MKGDAAASVPLRCAPSAAVALLLLPLERVPLNFAHLQVRARENEGTEREAPGPALGICHVHKSYF